jgi:hypothetical protein
LSLVLAVVVRAEVLQHMRDHLEELKRLGIEAINDSLIGAGQHS